MFSGQIISAAEALPGRDTPIECGSRHALWGRALVPERGPDQHALIDGEPMEELIVGMGCFWGAERLFWGLDGVTLTAVGYAGGHTPHPTYREVCSGLTGHTEVVLIHFDPKRVRLEAILKLFWERHDPTQGMRQGNDIGTQYRSALYWTTPEQEGVIRESAAIYRGLLDTGGAPDAAGVQITTELKPAPQFYYAEEYHQQYLHKNPDGYCGLRGTGAVCPL